MRRIALALVLLGPLSASGCVDRNLLNEQDLDSEPGSTASSSRAPVVVQNVEVAHDDSEQASDVRVSVPIPASNADHPRPDPVFFRLGAGRGALSHVDLQACRDAGLPPGYLRMRVTFRPNGRVARAAVESEAPPTPEALSCVGEQLEVAMVPAFDGEDFTLSRIFFVN